jgi:predicted ribosome quality control (RQC) complex YloA/Tae2 family protein
LRDEIAQIEFDIEGLESLATRAREAGVRDAPTGLTRGGSAQTRSTRKPYIEYRSGSGHAILVGRGAKDNDELTTKHARPNDLWLHVKGMPGAHVVVPLAKGTSCPPDVLVDAATLAAHHSDARNEETVEVSYTERRYVRKKKGQAPGKVTLEREKVIAVRVTRERIDRLTASRVE